jgi:hypothetical protein
MSEMQPFVDKQVDTSPRTAAQAIAVTQHSNK